MEAVCERQASAGTAPGRLKGPDVDHLLQSESVRETLGPGGFPGLRRPFRSLFWLLHVGFGTVCLILLLAVLAAIPGLNVLALGYLIDAQRRVAVSGRIRSGFPLLYLAPRVGVICFFTLLFLIPLRIAAFQAGAAIVVRGGDPSAAAGYVILVRILQVLIATHLILAIARGGTASCFLRPIRNLRWMIQSVRSGQLLELYDTWGEQLSNSVRPVHHFWLGLKAAIGALLWLAIPTVLLVCYSAPDRVTPLFVILSLLGGLLMIPVAAWLPMLQTHQAVTGRFWSIFEVSQARQVIRRAPISWLTATILLYALTLPLHLTKIRLPPADAFLLITPIFIVLTYPSRLCIAWAYHRGMHRERDARRIVLWPSRLLMLPVLAFYAFFLFLTPAVSELGKAAPLENHAFLAPAPRASPE